MIEHSESKAVFVEDGEQLGKIREVEDDLPNLEHIIVFEPGDADIGDAISLDDLRERGRGRDAEELDAARSRRSAPTTSRSPSTPRAPPARPRAVCSRTATTATSPR